jgi:WD40 repeat protein
MGNNQNEDAIYEKNIYSYQVIDYEKGLTIASREEKDLVHSLAINPSNPFCFASCNDGRVTFWEVKFSIIIKKKVCWLGGETPTCCVFYNPPKGQPDLLVGTSTGTLGMISRKQYWTIFKKG